LAELALRRLAVALHAPRGERLCRRRHARPPRHPVGGGGRPARGRCGRSTTNGRRRAAAVGARALPARRLRADAADAHAARQVARRPPAARAPASRARRSRLPVTSLVFVTQQVDPEHSVLAATVPKLRALAGRFDEVTVLAASAVPGVLPANCRVVEY